jgi:hypothetical protein
MKTIQIVADNLKREVHKGYFFILLFTLFCSCTSSSKEEYEILNIAINKCVFKAIDPKEISKIMEQERVSSSEALDIIDERMKDRRYTFSMSDTLYTANLPKNTWDYLHYNDIFENNDPSILIDFSKIQSFENRKRINRPIKDDDYLGHFKFYRVLFDKWKERAYMRIDIPKSKGRIYGSFGLMFKKENGKWKLGN